MGFEKIADLKIYVDEKPPTEILVNDFTIITNKDHVPNMSIKKELSLSMNSLG